MCDLNNPVPWIALIVSVASAGFAGSAFWVSREKLRLDLYNRRFEIFRAAVDFSNVISAWTGSDEQTATRQLFIRAVVESQFLFSKESGIFEILSEVHTKSFKRLAMDTLREHAAIMPKEVAQAAMESVEAVNWIVFEAVPQLAEKMKPFLNFHTLTAWPGAD
jgi:hypothetical protein